MIEKFIHRLFLRRHFWRSATFGEVADLYASRLLRQTANSLISMMVAVFLYKSGYSLVFIAGFYACYFGLKGLFSYPCARIIARYGSKHGTLYANLLAIPSLLAFSMLNEYGIWSLLIFMVVQVTSVTLYDFSHMVNFSKVKSNEYAGKEIGFMNSIDKLATGLSPLIGGMIAWLMGPEVTIWIAAGLFAVAAVPLFRTAEPVKLRQKIDFRGFPWRQARAGLLAQVAFGADFNSKQILWPLFLVAVLFAGSGEDVYAKIGTLASITVVVGIITSHVFGKLIDKRKGYDLLRYSAIGNAIVHAIRPFAGTPLSAGLINAANETATTGYTMAFMRGMYDMSDRSGHRLAYLFYIEIAYNVGSGLLFAGSSILLLALGEVWGLTISFWLMVPLVFFMARPNFPLYRR